MDSAQVLFRGVVIIRVIYVVSLALLIVNLIVYAALSCIQSVRHSFSVTWYKTGCRIRLVLIFIWWLRVGKELLRHTLVANFLQEGGPGVFALLRESAYYILILKLLFLAIYLVKVATVVLIA